MDFSEAEAAVTAYMNFLLSKQTPGMPAPARLQINAAMAQAAQLGRDLMNAQLVQDQATLDQLKTTFTNEATLLKQRTTQLKGAFTVAADAAQAVALALAIAAAVVAV